MNSAGQPQEYVRLVGQFPRFSADVFPAPSADGTATGWTPSPEEVSRCLEAGRHLFPMPEVKDDTRFQAQLWWWSMCGAIVGPSLALIITDNIAPVLDWDKWRAFARDNYWVGFQAQEFQRVDRKDIEVLRDYGTQLAHFLEAIAEPIAQLGGIKPAPLWAVAADAVANAAVAVGNELMEPWAGCLVGYYLVAGMQEVHQVPLPRFVDVADGEVREWDRQAALAGEEPDIDVVSHLERATCCMIFHSPGADLCVSCPKHPRELRHDSWISMSAW